MSASNDFDPVPIAIEICTKDAFKLEVFSGTYPPQETPENCKKNWDEKVEVLARSLLDEHPNLEKNQQEAVISVVFSIAFRMLRWIEFYIGTFGFTRDFCVEFLDSPLFTERGIIDPRRVEVKMLEKPLSSLQKFRLACFYCQWRSIPSLFNTLSTEEKSLVYNEHEPELVRQLDIIKFWSYYNMGELDKLKEKKTDNVEQFRQKVAVTSGSKLAINFCIERAKSKQNCPQEIAISLFRHRIQREIKCDESLNIVDDWIVFGDKKYDCNEASWIPDNFFADILYSLYSGMNQTQRRYFWRHICSTKFILSDRRINQITYIQVLEGLLCFPHQDMFLELLKSAWSRLSLSVFSVLLIKIIKRIEPESGQFWYGEENSYDYRKLLMDIWTACPEAVKKHLFKNNEYNILQLFKAIYNLKSFNERDGENIKLMIKSGIEEDKGFGYIKSEHGISVSTMLLERKRRDLYEDLISTCLISPEAVNDYKFKVLLSRPMNECLELLKKEKWHEAEEALKWSEYELTQEEIQYLKNLLISSKEGEKTCIALWEADPNVADSFIRWAVPADSLQIYKDKLILGEIGQEKCRELCKIDLEIADTFIQWCLPLESQQAFKTLLIDRIESVCICTKYVFIDNTPELAERLIRWCLPERMVRPFKRYLGHNKLEVFPIFKSTFDDIENCTNEEFPDKIFDWKPAEKMFSWCFAVPNPEENIAAPEAGEGVVAPEAREVIVAPEAGEVIVAPEAGEVIVSPETFVLGAEVEKTLASNETEESLLLDQAEKKNPLLDKAEELVPDRAEEENLVPDRAEETPPLDPEEIRKFKRSYLRKFHREIIYKCIESNNWNVADKFISWLNLDELGLKMAKIEQICSDTETADLLTDLLSRAENDPKFAETGGKQRAIERFIHWFLVDEAIVEGFIKKLNRFSDDNIVQNIILKLKNSEDLEIIKGLLTQN